VVPVAPVQPVQPQPQPVQPQQTYTKPLSLTKDRFAVLRFVKRWWWIVALVLIVGGALTYFAYNYFDTRNQLLQLSNAENNTSEENQKLTEEITKYLELPKETPTIATVSDVDKLKSQEFFANAQNGDKVLVFSQAGRALLYRPSTHKVIEYSKVDFNSEPAQ